MGDRGVLLTISIDATSMKIWCSINGGTTALILQSSCGEIKQLSGSYLANNTTFCLTTNLTCSASVTLANNSSMQSTLICYSNNGWVNLKWDNHYLYVR
uniref:ASABF-related peptide n=1 Tax=Lubomirskia baikalensis TaxID=289074 RepID=G8ADN5_9METZ|nr:ASABF-related peptide [Lubomirskia baikalensis]